MRKKKYTSIYIYIYIYICIYIYIYIYIYIQTLQHIASFYCKFILKICTAKNMKVYVTNLYCKFTNLYTKNSYDYKNTEKMEN